MNKIFPALLISFAAILLLLFSCNMWIINQTRNQIYSDIDSIPANKTGLVLGTSKYFINGKKNLFFKFRIEAAVRLYRANKIKHIIVSGDNHNLEYNEAEDMKKALKELNVPDSCITLDFAGFRTLDSVVRCKKIFGQDKFTIISQEFHNQRALFISNHFGIHAIAFNAQDVPEESSITTQIREYFAKLKAVLDIYVLREEPKFLGAPVKINI